MNGSLAETGEVPPQPLRAILFDVDGTLADSDPLHFLAFKEILLEVRAWLLVPAARSLDEPAGAPFAQDPKGWVLPLQSEKALGTAVRCLGLPVNLVVSLCTMHASAVPGQSSPPHLSEPAMSSVVRFLC